MRRSWSIVGVLVAVSILLLASPLFAQNSPNVVNVVVDNIDDQTFPHVTLFVSVTDKQGRSIQNLTPENFAVAEQENQSTNINSAAPIPATDRPVQVVLAIDISGSIEPGLEHIKASARQFVEALEPHDQIALLYFGNSARMIEGFTTDHGKVINQINQINPGMLEDYTALYPGAVMGIRTAHDSHGNRPVVVLMTDGKQTQEGDPSLGVGDVTRESDTKQVPLYVIGVRSDQIDEEVLHLMASNGSYYPIEDTSQLAAAYESVSRDMRHQYQIAFLSQIVPDNQQHTMMLTVNVPGRGSQTSSFTVMARTPPLDEGFLNVQFRDPPERASLGSQVDIEAEITMTDQVSSIELLYGDTSIVRQENPVLQQHNDITARWSYEWTPDKDDFDAGEEQLRILVTDTLDRQSEATHTMTLDDSIPMWIWIAIAVSLLIVMTILFVMQRDTNDDSSIYNNPLPTPPVMPNTGFVNVAMPPTTMGAQPTGPSFNPYGEVAAVGVAKTAAATASASGSSKGVQQTEFAQSAPGSPRAMLVVHRGKANVANIPLSVDKVIHIGREQGSDLMLDDTQVSSKHASIRFQENGFTIRDLGSTNGTVVNGQRITKVRMQDNDQIEIGNTLLVFKQL